MDHAENPARQRRPNLSNSMVQELPHGQKVLCVCRQIIRQIVRFALGVPQGSISGPLLFAQYLSTLTEEIGAAVTSEVRTVEYADDVNIWLRLQRNADNTYDTTQAQTALNVIST